MAEVRKRGDDFWNEFEFYLSDLVVGLVMDVVLVALMAPTAVLGAPRAASLTGAQLQLLSDPAAVCGGWPDLGSDLGTRTLPSCCCYMLTAWGCSLVHQGCPGEACLECGHALLVAAQTHMGMLEGWGDVRIMLMLHIKHLAGPAARAACSCFCCIFEPFLSPQC